MDPKVVAGIGNIYSDEILFHAGVRPTRQVSSLTDKELSAIYKWIRPVLIKGIKAKGSSVGDFVRTDGSWGQMGKFHFVYGRKGQKCKKCGTIIEAVKLGGRTGSFCPKCRSNRWSSLPGTGGVPREALHRLVRGEARGGGRHQQLIITTPSRLRRDTPPIS